MLHEGTKVKNSGQQMPSRRTRHPKKKRVFSEKGSSGAKKTTQSQETRNLSITKKRMGEFPFSEWVFEKSRGGETGWGGSRGDKF